MRSETRARPKACVFCGEPVGAEERGGWTIYLQPHANRAAEFELAAHESCLPRQLRDVVNPDVPDSEDVTA